MRYAVQLSRTLHLPLCEVLKLPEQELMVQAAFDLLQNPEFQEKTELELNTLDNLGFGALGEMLQSVSREKYE